MRHSIYLQLAAFFVRADLRRAQRVSRARQGRVAQLPLGNRYLLRDIGLEAEYFPNGVDELLVADRWIRQLRYILHLRIKT